MRFALWSDARVVGAASALVLVGGVIAVPLHHDSDSSTASIVEASPSPSVSISPSPTPSPSPTGQVLSPSKLRQQLTLDLVRSGGLTAKVVISIGSPTHPAAAPVLAGSDNVVLTGGDTCATNEGDAVIPVVLSMRNTTRANTATIAWQWGVDSMGDLSATQPQFETAAPDQTFCAPSQQIPTSTLSFLTDPLDFGQFHYDVGFVVIHRYFTEMHPQGDPSRLTNVRLGFNGAPDDSSNRWQPTNMSGPGFSPYRGGQLFRVEATVGSTGG